MQAEIKMIPLDEVLVEDVRVRTEFKDADVIQLAESIWQVGLLHPINLRPDGKTLVAGETRTRAIRLLSENEPLRKSLEKQFGPAKPAVQVYINTRCIPASIQSDELNDIELIQAELFENIHRADISWQDRSRALSRLHKLRVEQFGEAPSGARTDQGDTRQTIKKTAQEAYRTDNPSPAQKQAVSVALDLSEYLDDPIVAAAPDEKTAAKIVRDLRAAKARKEKADSISLDSLKHSVIHGDVYEELETNDQLVGMDIIVCDPPYGRGMDKHGFSNKHDYDDSRETFGRFMEELLPVLYTKVAGPKAHIYVFCDINDVMNLRLSMMGAGWDVWQWPIIWDKGNVGTFGNASQGPRHCYDAVVYGWKGGMQPTAMFRDVININQDQDLSHPAGKPVAVYMDLLKRSAVAGMKVFDPMVGGGTFFEACHNMKLHGTGVEMQEKYYHMAIETISELK